MLAGLSLRVEMHSAKEGQCYGTVMSAGLSSAGSYQTSAAISRGPYISQAIAG
jgi:hypothetical protein